MWREGEEGRERERKMSGSYGEEPLGEGKPAPGLKSSGQRVGYASHTLQQVGTEGFWDNLGGQVHFDTLNRHLSHFSQV